MLEDFLFKSKSKGKTNNLTAQNENSADACMSSTTTMALMALKLTSQPWNILGHGTDINTAASSDLSIVVERLTSLFLVRIVAVVSQRRSTIERRDFVPFRDISTSRICTDTLKRNKPWPEPVNEVFISRLRTFINRILTTYKDVHYHNFEHAYHVTISYNKLLDMMLVKSPTKKDVKAANFIIHGDSDTSIIKPTSATARKTYGLKEDPLAVLAGLFSALVHDVEHRGVSNRQLVMENDELALLYNDQSVAEQRSLAVAFSELMKDEFKNLRDAIFESPDDYRRFRRTVIDLVLATDIASPERTQLVKSKWKEAFGETKESIERKIRKGSNCSVKQSLNLSNKSLLIDDDEVDEDNNNSTSEMIDGLEHMVICYDNEEDSPSATPESITPESNDGLEPILEDNEKFHASNSSTLSALPPPPPVDDDFDTPVMSGNKNKKSLRRENVIEGQVMKMQDAEHVEPSTRFNRRVTHFGGMTTKVEVETTPIVSTSRNALSRPSLCRHFSSPDFSINQPVRLGIRRSLDLNGEAIEKYRAPLKSSDGSFRSLSGFSEDGDCDPVDEPDELKAMVVLEHFMRAADIGPNMQGWEQMEKWSDRLFLELKTTYHKGFGEDPQKKWYQNQITFLESYILPLARRLGDMGVFGESIGPMFEEIVKQNRDKWISDGFRVTSRVAEKWNSIVTKGSK
mmetsp:Transcript_9480/g.14642  ORF Transcript_9480/g.14642 Transcript_9480/m.14642 type:complete len:686 (+) Transcript_9480:171-2228(+)